MLVVHKFLTQQATGLLSKERMRSLVLLTSTIGTKTMYWRLATPCTQTIGDEVMSQKQRVP